MVATPTTPFASVERIRVMFPYTRLVSWVKGSWEVRTIRIVRSDGLGTCAMPLRFGCPAGAERSIRRSVVLKPLSPLRPELSAL